jgi:hypothetical protein
MDLDTVLEPFEVGTGYTPAASAEQEQEQAASDHTVVEEASAVAAVAVVAIVVVDPRTRSLRIRRIAGD